MYYDLKQKNQSHIEFTIFRREDPNSIKFWYRKVEK